ncbi:tryptophan--tRNA ligase [Ahrensia marina]|uniref:tryptophan--tRNA ligase n=1 Tax=Ahrensia marina TaxID=1514904 RepID=UPI0035CFBBE0
MSEPSGTPAGTTFEPRVFSGVQPSGQLTLGNYLGAIRNFVPLQDTHDCIYCMVDLHAITQWQDPTELAHATRQVAAAFMAAGVDPDKSLLFNQSLVPQHAQLGWVFNCVARVGWLNRMTQFKEKAGKDQENASVGLYAYPTLMAADILLYKATAVPVGEDQKQHLELTRDIAQKFNHDWGKEVFPITEPLILGDATRVMSLRDGTKKMSKSDPSDLSRINLTDDRDTIAKKFKKAKTDPEPLPETVEGLEGRPEAQNLVDIFAALADISKEDVILQFGGKGFGTFKPALAEVAVGKLGPLRDEMERLLSDPAEIDSILHKGAQRAQAVAAPVLDEVYDVLGLVR